MKKAFTHENRMIVYNMKNLLQGEGIDALLKNEFSGGGAGDLPAFDIWPEIWVDDAHFLQAQSVLRKAAQSSPGEDWLCSGCGETNDAGFAICWNCRQSLD